MSKSIMVGFIIGMSIQIIVVKLGKIFGIEVDDGKTLQKLWLAISQIEDWNWTATVIGVGALLLIFAIPIWISLLFRIYLLMCGSFIRQWRQTTD